ncbi:MAG TPA: DUF1015 domain-containing protein [Nitrospinota bacterium]|nr:DUF1015 domain-containing protein [Nitrospinota bacterium]|tara:strand:+ start:23721 stop:25025 length:1305 start_codon:yes stop_codon:yes gene_type:complete
MPIIEPFKGVIYNRDIIDNIMDVLAPPYDVISEQEQQELYDKHRRNVIRLILGKTESSDAETNNRYTRAATTLDEWLQDGILTRLNKPTIYLYAQDFVLNGKTLRRTGFICRVKIEEYGNSIFPHEKTLAGPKIDRLKLIRACEMNLSPVFGLYTDKDRMLDNLWKPVMRAKADFSTTDSAGVSHFMWFVDDKDIIGKVKGLLIDHPVVIADGHHRYETAKNYRNERRKHGGSSNDNIENYDYVMMFLANTKDQGFTVLPTHRLVKEANLDTDKILECLSVNFHVEEKTLTSNTLPTLLDELASAGKSVVSFIFYAGGGKAFLLKLKKNPERTGDPAEDAVKKLDVFILEEKIFVQAMEISREAVTNKQAVGFTSEAKDAIAAVDSKTVKYAFLLNYTSVHSVMDVASKGGIMPQKSTYFYPKLITGLVFNPVN